MALNWNRQTILKKEKIKKKRGSRKTSDEMTNEKVSHQNPKISSFEPSKVHRLKHTLDRTTKLFKH